MLSSSNNLHISEVQTILICTKRMIAKSYPMEQIAYFNTYKQAHSENTRLKYSNRYCTVLKPELCGKGDRFMRIKICHS